MAKKFYIETYGCQMNVADSEVVAAILTSKGFIHTQDKNEADVILVNTCSVRENAEQRVRGRIQGSGNTIRIYWWALWDAWQNDWEKNFLRKKRM